MDSSREAFKAKFYNNPRKSGAFLLIVGLFLLYQCTYLPLQEAADGASEVRHLSGRGTGLGVVGLILGLALLAGGRHVGEFMHPPPGKSKVPGIIAGVLLGVVGLGVFFAVKAHVESLGYTFSR